ncbi:Siderophore staphylobactin biosynthesis protein SbnE [Staphylococcus aureus]|nr:Siderophore staphylobactin biosynthesis protein SbnE [Staphylococcus aureus]
MQNKELIQHAAYAAIERILNEYFREENLYQVPPQNHQWSIQLSELETLTGQFAYWSAMGIICIIQKYGLLMVKVRN